MLQHLLKELESEYRSMARDMAWRTEGVLEMMQDAKDATTDLVEDALELSVEAAKKYIETGVVMGKVKGCLELYNHDRVRINSVLGKQLEKIDLTSVDNPGELMGMLAYFVTHPRDAGVFSAVQAMYAPVEGDDGISGG